MVEIHKKGWGYEDWLVNTEKYCGKLLSLKKQHMGSLHYHKIKDETFYILSGKVYLELEDKKIIMNEGDVQRILPGQKHRYSGLEDTIIIEFSTQHFDSDTYRDEIDRKVTDEEFIKIGGIIDDNSK